MSLTDQLLAWLSLYGLPVLFGVLVIACAGIPLPCSLMLVAAGSFVQLGEMKLWQVVVVASAGSVLGDQIGYVIGRRGGHLAERLSRRIGSEQKLKDAEALTKRWGGWAIFFSRWLVTPLGAVLNVTSGLAGYSWARFFLWDLLGEVVWVVIYVMLGQLFSEHVQALVEILGNLTWVIVGLIVIVILGWQLRKNLRQSGVERTTAGERIEVPNGSAGT